MVIAEAGQSWLIFWGHFHPMLVHLPIGMFYMAGILHFFYTQKQPSAQPIVVQILIWTSAFSIISAAMGWSLAQSGEYDPGTLQIHQWLGVSTCVLSVGLTYVMRAGMSIRLTNLLFMLGLLCLTITGHYGGNLTHGSDYLTASLPAPAREMLGIEVEKEAEEIPKITNLKEAVVYTQLVKPILTQRCISCHNAEKQKGKLRLDAPNFILAGGEEGPIIAAGKPLESELIKRLLLEENDEHHMPPKGKTPLTENEISLLHWWIQQGADFNKKVAQLPSDEKINAILKTYTQAEVAQESAVFKQSVDAADEADLARIRKHGLLANPVSKDQNYIEVNAINAPRVTNKELADLRSINAQIIRLKLGNTQFSGDFMKEIADMPLLIFLDLQHTKITDQDLENLKSLAYLESINLVGTQISDRGLQTLAKIKSLKRVYIWQTRVSEKGVAQLKKMRPDVAIQSGFKGQWPIKVDSAQLALNK
jgi:uncharacterized membrane protein/mono/diheme cytochrome c family protein